MSEYHDTETGEILPKTSLGAMPPPLAAAIIAIMKGARRLGVDERNAHGGYNYVSVDKFYETYNPLMAEAGLLVLVDETAFDVREGAENREGRRASWAFVKYDVWLAHESGVMWGPLRRHVALPMTGAQTSGSAESYVRKAFVRHLFVVATGEKDADDIAPSETAPVTRGATRTAQPRRPTPATAASSPTPAAPSRTPSSDNGVPKWIGEFLARESYEIDPQKAGGWSAWEKHYLRVAEFTESFEQYAKLIDDNSDHAVEFVKAVKPEVYENFLKRRGEIEAKYFPKEPAFVSPTDAETILQT